MEYVELFTPILQEIITYVVLIVVGFAAAALRKALRHWQYVLIEDWVKELIEDAVLMAQERYWQNSGSVKFDQAIDWVLDAAAAKGIELDEEYIGGLIDAAVKRMREELIETWYPDETPNDMDVPEID